MPILSLLPTWLRGPLRHALILLLIVCLSGCSHPETPAEALDKIAKAWPSRGVASPDDVPKEFVRLSRRAARDHGIALLPPIMTRAKNWQGEEGLVFLGAVYFIPPDQALPILEEYQRNGQPWEKQAATDFLIEIKQSIPRAIAEMPPEQFKKLMEDTAP